MYLCVSRVTALLRAPDLKYLVISIYILSVQYVKQNFVTETYFEITEFYFLQQSVVNGIANI